MGTSALLESRRRPALKVRMSGGARSFSWSPAVHASFCTFDGLVVFLSHRWMVSGMMPVLVLL